MELSYLDSNQDKQNQNLLCYHYTIGQSYCLLSEKRCKDRCFYLSLQVFYTILFCYQQEIVLLTTLHEQVFVVEQVCCSDLLVEGCELLLVE